LPFDQKFYRVAAPAMFDNRLSNIVRLPVLIEGWLLAIAYMLVAKRKMKSAIVVGLEFGHVKNWMHFENVGEF
jgi:hypothetical protein